MTLPDEIILRQLRPSDLDQILPLERTLFGPGAWTYGMFREEIDGWGRWYLLAEREQKILGYAGLWFDGEISQVMTIGVAPNHQRKGIGDALMSALIEQSQALGATAVDLEVRVDNAPAIRLYEKFGFSELGIRKRYYQPEDVDALVMRLDLASLAGSEVVG